MAMNIAHNRSTWTAIASLLLLLWPVTSSTLPSIEQTPVKTIKITENAAEQPGAPTVYYASYPAASAALQPALAPAHSEASIYQDIEPWALVGVVLVLVGIRDYQANTRARWSNDCAVRRLQQREC